MPRPLPHRTRRRGSVLAFVVFAMIVFIGMAALSVDVALMHLTRTQLRKTADAAALAASGNLAFTQDIAAARQVAKDVAAANPARGQTVQLADDQIVFGRSDYSEGRWGFFPTLNRPNAVRVSASLSEGSPTLFGRLLGVERFFTEQPATAAAQTRDICIVLDRSGSMRADITETSENGLPPGVAHCDPPHPTLSRWGVVAQAINQFLWEISSTPQSEHVGLVTYSSATDDDDAICGVTVTTATIEQPLIDDATPVMDRIDARSQMRLVGSTNISAGIDLGVQVVLDGSRNRRYAEKIVILLTDGIENRGRDSRQAAADARQRNVTIHTISVGEGADLTRMRQIAEITGGEHLHAPTPDEVRRAFLRIARGIPSVLID